MIPGTGYSAWFVWCFSSPAIMAGHSNMTQFQLFIKNSHNQWIVPKWSVYNYFMQYSTCDSIYLCVKFSWNLFCWDYQNTRWHRWPRPCHCPWPDPWVKFLGRCFGRSFDRRIAPWCDEEPKLTPARARAPTSAWHHSAVGALLGRCWGVVGALLGRCRRRRCRRRCRCLLVLLLLFNILDSKLLQAMLTDLLAGFSSKSACLSERSAFNLTNWMSRWKQELRMRGLASGTQASSAN